MAPSARYDAIADLYAAAASDGASEPVMARLLELVGNVSGRRVLDLACGHGRLSRELARRGAAVLGVDLSNALLDKARAVEAADRLGIDYVHLDAASPEALAGQTFDVVVSHFGLSDIDDLDGTLATVARVLRTGGLFVFSILHPCFPGWGEDAPSSWPPEAGYYAEGWWLASNTGFRGKVGANHRTLATYLNALIEHNLAIDRVTEPQPTGEWVRSKPGPMRPVFLVVRSRRR